MSRADTLDLVLAVVLLALLPFIICILWGV